MRLGLIFRYVGIIMLFLALMMFASALVSLLSGMDTSFYPLLISAILTLILGGVYLIVRKVIDWRIPVFFIGTAFILFWIQTGVIYSVESGTDNALYQIREADAP